MDMEGYLRKNAKVEDVALTRAFPTLFGAFMKTNEAIPLSLLMLFVLISYLA